MHRSMTSGNQKHIERLLEGVASWNSWRQKAPKVQPNLSNADLAGANLAGANLEDSLMYKVDLRKADLTNAILKGAMLLDACLEEAFLIKADLTETNLYGADLMGAKLNRAHLEGTTLKSTNLTGANLCASFLGWALLQSADLGGAMLHRSILKETLFIDANLSEAKGLNECFHNGPSTVDTKTIRKSGSLPEAFLRGCGLSDWEIEAARLYNPDLTPGQIAEIQDRMFHLRAGGVIQYHSCFISYSSKDNDFAHKLHDSLQAAGVRCWFAPEKMKIGSKIRYAIDQAIHLQDQLLLILSEHSVASPWVEQEVETALEKEDQEGRTVLLPIRIDQAVMDSQYGWAAHLRRTRHIGDFSGWTDRAKYSTAFKRLLKDLRATG